MRREAILGAQRESHAVDNAHEAAADMAAASSLNISTLSEDGLDTGHAELDFLFALRVGHGTLLTLRKRLFCEQHVAFADAGVPQRGEIAERLSSQLFGLPCSSGRLSAL